MSAASSDKRRWARLHRASRRGMLELDLFLVPFSRERAPALSEDELRAYERLLSREDWELFDWLLGAAPVDDAQLAPMVALLRDWRRER